jgi:hypothetical protein
MGRVNASAPVIAKSQIYVAASPEQVWDDSGRQERYREVVSEIAAQPRGTQ